MCPSLARASFCALSFSRAADAAPPATKTDISQSTTEISQSTTDISQSTTEISQSQDTNRGHTNSQQQAPYISHTRIHAGSHPCEIRR
jgi:hypothetical protein